MLKIVKLGYAKSWKSLCYYHTTEIIGFMIV